MADITAVMNVLANAQKQVDAQKGQLTKAYGGVIGAIGDTANVQVRAKNAEAIVSAQKDLGELHAQQNARQAATALGTNMDDPSQIVTALSNSMRQAAMQAVQQAGTVADIESNNDLFTNPLGFLRDFAVGDQERSKLQGDLAQLQVSSDALNRLNRATTGTAAAQRSIAQTKTAASIQAHQEQLAAEADALAAQGRATMASTNVDMINKLGSLDANKTAYAVQSYRLQAQSEATSYLDSIRQAEAEGKKNQIELYNTGAKYRGLAPVSDFSALKLTPEGRARIQHFIGLGWQVKQAVANGTPVQGIPWGANPIQAVSNMHGAMVTPTDAQENTIQALGKIRAEALNPSTLQEMYLETGAAKDSAAADLMARTALSSTKAARDQAQYSYLMWKLGKYSADPWADADSGSNPYVLGSLTDIDYPELTTNKFLSQYLTPSITAAKDAGQALPLNPQVLLNEAVTATSGKDAMTTNEVASGISSLVQQLMMQNNLTHTYKSFAMPIQTALPTTVHIDGNAYKVDLADTSSIMATLAKALAVKKSAANWKQRLIEPFSDLDLIKQGSQSVGK